MLFASDDDTHGHNLLNSCRFSISKEAWSASTLAAWAGASREKTERWRVAFWSVIVDTDGDVLFLLRTGESDEKMIFAQLHRYIWYD